MAASLPSLRSISTISRGIATVARRGITRTASAGFRQQQYQYPHHQTRNTRVRITPLVTRGGHLSISPHHTGALRALATAATGDKMKTVSYDRNGDSSVLEITDMPKPNAGDNEVLVKMEWAGVNFVDTYYRSGLYPSDFPAIVGREGAGVIEKIGPNVRAEYGLSVGDRVAVYAEKTEAEYCATPAWKVLKLPDSISTRDGAALMLQGLTAWTLLRDAHEVKPGETVLIQAAAGGTGGLMVQMAKALGATVIGTASTPEKVAVAKAHGADHVINYTTTDLLTEVMRLTGGQGCDAVFSGVGQATFDADLECTRRKGTFVTFGNASGAVEGFRPLALGKKNVKLVRPRLDNYVATREEFVTRSRELLELVAGGKVKVSIGGEYTMEETAKAQDDLVGKKTMGKLLIKIA